MKLFFSLLPQALRKLARSPYGPIDQGDAPAESPEPSSSNAEQQIHEQTKDNKRPITLEELLTPSEKELARGHMLSTDKPPQDSSTKTNIISRLKVTKPRKEGKSSGSADPINPGRKAEPDLRQVQRAFVLTPQQLVYVPIFSPFAKSCPLNYITARMQSIKYYTFP